MDCHQLIFKAVLGAITSKQKQKSFINTSFCFLSKISTQRFDTILNIINKTIKFEFARQQNRKNGKQKKKRLIDIAYTQRAHAYWDVCVYTLYILVMVIKMIPLNYMSNLRPVGQIWALLTSYLGP